MSILEIDFVNKKLSKMSKSYDDKSCKVEMIWADLNRTESFVEDLIVNSYSLIDYFSGMKLVGRHPFDENNNSLDLLYIDSIGDLVVVEVKRDKVDTQSRKEKFETQSIRYASAVSHIKTMQDLIRHSYHHFLVMNKHIAGYQSSYHFFATIDLESFFKENKLDCERINKSQKILLISSGFSQETLSSIRWLKDNFGLSIDCIIMRPVAIDGVVYCEINSIDISKITPLKMKNNMIVREKRPDKLDFSGIVKNRLLNPGDEIRIKGYSDILEVHSETKIIYRDSNDDPVYQNFYDYIRNLKDPDLVSAKNCIEFRITSDSTWQDLISIIETWEESEFEVMPGMIEMGDFE